MTLNRILLIGPDGQLGWELRHTLRSIGQVVPIGRAELDLTDRDAIRRVIRCQRPDLIVNAAAYTQVDKAEIEGDLAMQVNGTAPGIIAEEAKRARCALIHYSTDYVFSGSIERPYLEDDQPDPINVYGATKLAGENAIRWVGAPYLILRTSWVFGSKGKNFLTTILKLAREREELRIVDDQFGVPTWSRAIAEATAQILTRMASGGNAITEDIADSSGVYHICGAEPTSWFGFAREILAKCPRIATALAPVSSAEHPATARRPRYSVLSAGKLERAFSVTIASWRDQLEFVFKELDFDGAP